MRSGGGSGDLTLHNLLLSAADPIEASNRIVSAPFKDCADLLAGLGGLDARPSLRQFDPRSYRGLVEELLQAAQSTCSDQGARKALKAQQKGIAPRLALSLLETDAKASLELAGNARGNAALLVRRSELLFQLERHEEARAAVVESITLHDDAQLRATAVRLTLLAGKPEQALLLCGTRAAPDLQALRVGALASLARYEEVYQAVQSAPLHVQSELAEHAARFAKSPLVMVEAASAPALLVLAVAQSLADAEPATSLALRVRAAAQLPDDADVHIALAESLEAQGRGREAIVAWDRAAAIAPAAERATLAGIRLLADTGSGKQALARAARLQKNAERSQKADDWRMASLAHRYAGSPLRAVELAKLALSARPGDGRLTSELASRQEEANQKSGAKLTLTSLLVCGAHGRPWHRHEIMARLAALADEDEIKELASRPTCTAVEPEDLAAHLATGADPED